MPRAAAPSPEPQRRVGQPLPPGYVFVPKGNVYVTSNCRRRTREARRTVYSVIGAGAQAKPPTLGILVPREVARAVRADEAETRADRARAVARHDAGLERRFRDVVAREFPGAPPAEIAPIVRRAMLKGSRRVGRTATLDLEVKARLAVRAHIRHQHTDYDALLRRNVKKDRARKLTFDKSEEVVRAWGGQPCPSKKQGKGKEQSRGKKTKDQARKPDQPKGDPAVPLPIALGKEAPAKQKPGGSSAVRTPKQAARAAKRRGRKDKNRQERQAHGNTATTSAASTTWATPASGTAAAPICIDDDDDDEPEPNEYNQGDEDDESDEYSWPETDDEMDSDVAENEYQYENDTAEDDLGVYWRL